jgi:hypothetical protein
MTAPSWLTRARGDATRAARLRQCPRCRGAVLVGLDGDVAAGTARVDPAPLNSLGEAAALIDGRRTYTISGDKHRKQIDYRQDWHISEGTKGRHVVAEHKCEWTPPREHIQFTPRTAPREVIDSDIPPF